ncbi:nucleotidyltransferase family protein [Bradyrhizobium sp.]|jgi:predicted nucleotidyltransferase|uniref:nucleotidyltransferase family protein n=1 Tax=Bradyrhizobium sp. TaxID=376 RepID=UPI003C26F369
MNRARAIEVLQTLRPLLEARGIARAGIFGSVGRDMAGARSDIDVVVAPAADRQLNLFDLGGVQTVLEEGFAGMEVDVVAEPIRQPELRAAVERDRVDAF